MIDLSAINEALAAGAVVEYTGAFGPPRRRSPDKATIRGRRLVFHIIIANGQTIVRPADDCIIDTTTEAGRALASIIQSAA